MKGLKQGKEYNRNGHPELSVGFKNEKVKKIIVIVSLGFVKKKTTKPQTVFQQVI